MKFVALFEDNPGVGETVRAEHMCDHLAFLERNAHLIDAAGPMHAEDGSGAGGLWIVETETASDVRKLVEEDPLWPTGLRKSVRICTWTQVFAEGHRRIKIQGRKAS